MVPVPSRAYIKRVATCAGLLAQPAPLSLFPNGFQAALMDAQAQAQQQPPPESSMPLQAPGERSACPSVAQHHGMAAHFEMGYDAALAA